MKIPEHAERVFKGVIYDVYQWQQEMFDGSFRTFEAFKRPDSVQVIAFDGDNILISHEEQPLRGEMYGFFGGRVEEGEEALDAAKRELREETGLGNGEWKHYKTIEAVGNQEWYVHIFFARNLEKIGPGGEDRGGEKVKILKLDVKEFADMLVHDKFRAKLTVDHLIHQDSAEIAAQQLKDIFHTIWND